MKQRQRLYLFRDGVLLQKKEAVDRDDPLGALRFIPKVIQSLALLLKTDEYELILITGDASSRNEEEEGEGRRALHEKMIEILQGEGIDFIDIYHAAEHIDRTQVPDIRKSLVIGGSTDDIKLAQRLGCRSMLLSSEYSRDALSPELSEHCIAAADNWSRIVSLLLGEEVYLPERKAEISRKTSETEVSVELNLDGIGRADISTGLRFLDHMLHQLARHGKMDLKIHARGDLEVDEHHTIEDTAIVLGQAFLKALGDKRGIQRYGFLLPMDDSLAQAAVDFSGRPYLLWDVTLHREFVGDVPADMIFHFFKSFTDEARCNLSLQASGKNDHHIAEALFKGFAKACRMAVRRNPLDMELPSTKGAL